MRANVAYAFHFPPSELARLTVTELLDWQAQAERIHEALQDSGAG